MSDNKVEVIQKKTILDLFIDGARKGFTIGTTSLLPNVMMAFVIIRILDVTGLLQLIGVVFQPVMGLWGLPGEAATVLITALMSMGGGVGVAMSLLSYDGYVSSASGLITQPQSAIDMIVSLYMYGPILVWIVLIIVLLAYNLDKIYPQIMKDLAKREAEGKL